MKYFFSILFAILFTNLVSQNVGINSSGAAPDASAMLDIVSTSKGLLIPRVALTAINAASPITSPLTSLMVYNTASAGAGSLAVSPGYYYWDGAKWVAFGGSNGKDWSLTGNAGTTVGTNFLGTTDNTDLQFKVNSIQGGLINIANNQTYYGYQAGLVTTGTFNSFFGSQSGKANTSGQLNTGHGYGSMRNITTGNNNTFLGTNAGANWQTTSGNTGVGWAALQGIGAGTGEYNTAIGYGACSGTTPNNLSVSTGSYNTYVGYNTTSAGAPSTYTNATAIGANAQAGGDDVMILGGVNGTNGSTADMKVGIGTTTPSYPLHVITSAFSYAGRFENSNANNQGLMGRNTAATGTGTGYGVYGYTGQNQAFGVRAHNLNTTGTGILASGENAGGTYLPAGSGGAFVGALTGLVSAVTGATGIGIRASGQGLATYPALAGGCGGAFSGTTMGLYGIANNTGNSTWGAYFTNGSATAYAYVGGRSAGGTDYKIFGPGSVSTIVKNTKNELVALYCPEAPEILFQDFGKGELVNGFVHIELDKDFAKNVTINKKHPLRVIIQLEGDCKGVFVTNHSSTGFDVKELQGGNSNVSFTYFVTANRADGEDENGVKGSRNADVRFGEAPSKAEASESPQKHVVKESAELEK